MRELFGEIGQVVWLLICLGAVAVGLIMVHPGLALAAAGLAGLVLWYVWKSRSRSVPRVPDGAGRDSREVESDEDDRMEVRFL